MDATKRRLIEECGNCHQPEDAHKNAVGTEQSDLDIFAALGSPVCSHFVASDAAVIYQKSLAITNNHEPKREPGTGRIGKRWPVQRCCGNRHRPGRENCLL